MDAPILLEARNLTKRYGSTVALDSVSFQVTEGVTGLLGPNGAGKSTAIKLFLGLLRPTDGAAEVMGSEPSSAIGIRSQLGYMPEHDCLPKSVTASEFLTHMAQVSGLPSDHARSRAADTMRHVGLDEARYRRIGEYSTGMMQRVKLAQAIVHDPRLILLDEPTSGLDPSGRDEMLDLVVRTARDFGISVVVSSHLMGEVERTCDSIIVLEGGSVTRTGRVAAFTEATQRLAIEVDSRRDELIAALARRGIQASVSGNIVLVTRQENELQSAIRDALVESEAPLRRMTPQRHLLTDIFRVDGTPGMGGMDPAQDNAPTSDTPATPTRNE